MELKSSLSRRIFWEALVAHLLILLMFNVIYYSDHRFYSTFSEINTYIFAFLIGVFARILLLALLLKVIINRVFKVKLTITESINYVLLSLLPLLSGIVYSFFSIHDYGTILWLGITYSSFLIAYGVHLTKQVDLIRMLVLMVSCHLLLFVFKAPFLGFRF